MKTGRPLFETEIGRAVSAWLEERGWEVYPEVAIKAYQGAADIVATHENGLVWVIECKMHFNYQLLKQAWRWRKFANGVSIAMPANYKMELASYKPDEDLKAIILERLGLGFFGISNLVVRQYREPVLRERAKDDFLYVVDPRHRQATPGSNCGGRFAIVDATCRNLLEAVRAEPGIALREAVGRIRHHYASDRGAYNSLRAILEKPGGAPEIKLEKRSGRWYCHLAPEDTF